MAKSKYIAVDFDGTCVRHEYPKVGEDIGAVPVLKALEDKGYKIILNTMRSEKLLEDAIQWFEGNGIKLYGVNENPDQKSWTSSPKVHADIYIDDKNLGCPLTTDYEGNTYVDWIKVSKMLGL